MLHLGKNNLAKFKKKRIKIIPEDEQLLKDSSLLITIRKISAVVGRKEGVQFLCKMSLGLQY